LNSQQASSKTNIFPKT